MNPLSFLFQALGIRMPQGFGTQPAQQGNTLPATTPVGGASMGPPMNALSGGMPSSGGTGGGFGTPGK